VLVVDVCSSADGHGVGYGIMLKRIERALRFGAAVKVPVFYVREATTINRAVFQLRSEDVEILPRSGWQALSLRVMWNATAPFRLGAPTLWIQRLLARTLLGSIYERVERSRRMPPRLRRFILRPRPLYRALKAANAEYAERSSKAWQRTFKQHASRRLREAERGGHDVPLRLSLPVEREREAAAAARTFGIGPGDPIVTVHVRESGYRATAGLRQRPLDELRNARIEAYGEAMDTLVQRGFTVVRLGDPTMTPVARPGVIDLATSDRRTEWLETWCIQRSAFLIGCDSGPSWLAFLLGVPVLTVNALHFRDIARPADRLISKLARARDSGRILTISEMLTEGYLRTGLDQSRYEHLDNEPADIAEAVIDMLDVVRGRREMTPAQQRFNDRLRTLGLEMPHEWSGLTGVAIVRQPRGTLSRRFAEKYL
jgi:putative glycosyltransferase (TIGR04372 family)